MIKCLTLHQPWATLMALTGSPRILIAMNAKWNETRSWGTAYRGPLGISASKKWDEAEVEWLMRGGSEAARVIRETLAAAGYVTLRELPLGSLICVTTLVDCPRIEQGMIPDPPEVHFGDYTPGRFALVTRRTRVLPEPIPVKGFHRLWTPEPEVGALLERFYGYAS